MRPDSGPANIAVVRRLFEAVETRGDPKDFAARWAAYVAMYDPDVVIHEAPSLPYGGDYSGDDAVARHAQAFNAAWQSLLSINDRSLEPRFLADGDHVIVFWRQTGTSEDGEIFDMPAVSVYQMKGGRIIDSRMFHFDTAAVIGFLKRARRPASVES
jgi:ketosteroid isomerase-like protein